MFGMNFDIFGQGNSPSWWYIILAAPLTLLTHLGFMLGSTLGLPAWRRRIAGSLSLSKEAF
ncbi:hypothetical protein F4821DRAFT_231253 [Hypoxylon rubiginosum]|uniref:Uncharacterized protein n=1 Tax=Hypoxylon rubiginosum TaxID=110542 RepID=A0ACC0D9Z0_9PEZI|nr:hypothetical protein F4821DRAFT_231253 [Hypoxylon rubiginosum]